MESIGLYLLKASAILLLFWGSYQMWLRRETLFGVNRLYLITGLIAALLLPWVRIPKEVVVEPSVLTFDAQTSLQLTSQAASAGIPWEWYVLALYLVGVLVCLGMLLRELLRLYRLIRSEEGIRKNGFVHIQTRSTEAPFSFFHYIFYNPDRHTESELGMILEHEQAHSAQWHTFDILLGRITTAVLWFNPMSWRYQKSIQQNLEYLADATAIRRIESAKAYQYTLLRVSGNPLTPALATPFYSSLIKKRIIMLNTNPSKTIHILKHLLILPVLALFLMAFGRETVYVTEGPAAFIQAPAGKVIELTIDKNTSDADLLKMKESLTKDQIDFSYTTVRNDSGQIISLEFDFNGKAEGGNPFSGSYASDSDGPIEPVLIRIDDTGGIVFGNAKSIGKSGTSFNYSESSPGKNKSVWVYESDDDKGEVIEIRKVKGEEVVIVDGKEVSRNVKGGKDSQTVMVKVVGSDPASDTDVQIHRISVDSDGDHDQIVEVIGPESARTIEIREVDGKKTIVVDGEEISEFEWNAMKEDELHSKHKMVVRESKVKGNNVFIVKNSDDDEDIEVLSKDGSGFLMIDTDGGAKPLYYIDGKKANAKKVKKLDPNTIDSIEVIKGEAAEKQYGAKAKDGVVRITTKKG